MVLWRDKNLKGKSDRTSLWIEAGEWALILGAVGLFTLTESYEPYVTFGLGLLCIFFAERGIRGKLIGVQSGLELPLFLFVLSAAVAAWISYNQGPALLQFARILGAAAIFFALKESKTSIPELVGFVFILAAAWLAVYWPLQNDFAQVPTKVDSITSIGLWMNSLIPAPPGPDIHKNVAAGALLISVPIGASLSWTFWKTGKRILSSIALASSIIILFGLVMTSSLGAWIGLIGMCITALLVLLQRHYFRDSRSKALFWLGVLIVGLFGMTAALGSGNLNSLIGQIPDPTGSLQSRLILWEEGAYLARDHLFTGSGLMSFEMVHAVYEMLIHVPFIVHSHNTFLEVFIEQGVVGALAILWGTFVVFEWAWKAVDRSDIPALAWGGLAAFCALTIHGMVEVQFYIERTLPVMGLVLGYCSFSARPNEDLFQEKRTIRKSTKAIIITILSLSAVGLAFWRQTTASWFANLGAIEQARVELRLYDPNNYENKSLDLIRQETDLSNAERSYEKALQYQSNNATALQRMSSIALSRGNYPQALEWTDLLWSSGNREPVTRLLYGDALVANGEVEKAAEIVRGLVWAEDRLLLDAWLRYLDHQDYTRAIHAWQTVLALDPSNALARENITKAQSFLNP